MRSTTCPHCGVRYRYRNGLQIEHECDENNFVMHQLTKLESSWADFLESTEGKFGVFMARRKDSNA